MAELDQALEALRANPEDQNALSGFYDLFLNSSFFVPTVEETIPSDDNPEPEPMEVPMIIDADGVDFLVFFDQQERLNEWAETDAPCLRLPGHVLAEMTTDQLHWAMNVGTEFNKQFAPDEIAWLKDVVKRCKASDQPS
ncbi:MAG: SseB family protein [Desulfuromonadales bacterium]|nr:SseB family protein [Desulfuromonadales bacterium]